jgi:hypothetical protein
MLQKCFLLSNLIKKCFAMFFNYFNRKRCENVFNYFKGQIGTQREKFNNADLRRLLLKTAKT